MHSPEWLAKAMNEPSAALPPRATRVVRTLWPGQGGTQRHLRRHGEQMVCVRYRHDTHGLTRYTTVELVVDVAPVEGQRFREQLFALRLDRRDKVLRAQLRAAGARWNHAARLWIANGATVRRLRLEANVVRRLKMDRTGLP